MSRDSVIVHY